VDKEGIMVISTSTCNESKMCEVNAAGHEPTKERRRGRPKSKIQNNIGGHQRPANATSAARPSSVPSPQAFSGPVPLAAVVFAGAVLVLVPVLDVDDDNIVEVLELVVVGTGANVSDGDDDARAQNCCASVSDVDRESEQLALTHATSSAGKFGSTQKQFTATTLEQPTRAIALARQSDTHEDTPLRLGNCAVLVDVADCVAFTLPVTVPVVVPVVLPVGMLVLVLVPLAGGNVDGELGASVDGGTSVAEPHACVTQTPRKRKAVGILKEVYISNVGLQKVGNCAANYYFSEGLGG